MYHVPVPDPFCLAQYTSAPMHAVMYNPDEPRLLATANAKEGVGLWDIRKPRRYATSFYIIAKLWQIRADQSTWRVEEVRHFPFKKMNMKDMPLVFKTISTEVY